MLIDRNINKQVERDASHLLLSTIYRVFTLANDAGTGAPLTLIRLDANRLLPYNVLTIIAF